MGGVRDEVIGTRRLAEMTGKSQRTAQRWLASGLLPSLPVPPRGHRRASLAELRKRLVTIAAKRQASDDTDDDCNDGERYSDSYDDTDD